MPKDLPVDPQENWSPIHLRRLPGRTQRLVWSNNSLSSPPHF
jgi:hypothetical protein